MAGKTLVVILLCAGAVWAAGSSTDTVESVNPSTAAVTTENGQPEAVQPEAADINSVIAALNYKIEVIQSRYVGLVNDMNALTAARKDVTEGIAGQITEQLKPVREDIGQMSNQIKLIRDEMAHIEEQLGIISSGKKSKK